MVHQSLFTNDTLLKAAEQFGTPLYVYNAAKIKQQCDHLQKAFNKLNTHFFYACKALTNVNIVKYIHHLGLSIDCVSVNEIKLALRAGVQPSKILFTPNNIDFEELQEAINIGTHINVDSLFLLEQFGQKYGNTYPILLRINPNIHAGGNEHISTGHDKSKFGIPYQQFDQLIDMIKKYSIHIKGLHLHTGSEINDDIFQKELELLFDLALQIPTVTILDLGGGFKIKYKNDDKATNINTLANTLEKMLYTFEQKYHRTFQIWFEPGKFIVGESGVLLVKVNQIKHNPTISFIGVNSGLNHLIRPMFYDAYHHIENISSSLSSQCVYTIVGNICETDDLAKDRMLSETQPGDILAIYNAGAYGFEMASNYNARTKPAEVFFYNNGLHLIRERESFDNLLTIQKTISF